MFDIRPGSAAAVERIFADSARPDPVVRGQNGERIGLLVSTMVFVGERSVVRVMEYEGELPDVVRHLAAQPEVREVERRIEPYLLEPRDMSTPEGAREYFRRAGMRCVLRRRHDDP